MTDIQQEKWLATYTELTAESILGKLGVGLEVSSLIAQFQAKKDFFYISLVQLPALSAFNGLLNTQCRDIQTYSQQRLIDYIILSEDAKKPLEEGEELRKQIESRRLELIGLGKRVTELERQHEDIMQQTYHFLSEHTLQWNILAEEITELLWELVKNCRPAAPQRFKNRLENLIKTQAADIEIPKETLKTFKLKPPVSWMIKAFIQVLIEIDTEVGTINQEKEKERTAAKEAEEAYRKMDELQKHLAAERTPYFEQLNQEGQDWAELRKNLLNIRSSINELLEQVRKDAFEPTEDVQENNEALNSNLMPPTMSGG